MWALVDCDNFFCSCERVFRPDLDGRPVVVLSNNDGCVVARSKEAKALGIGMGLPYYQMKERFPFEDITAFSSNYVLYADMSARVMATLRLEAPVLHQYSIDEAFIDLTGMEHLDLKKWGEELSKKVWRWTGIPVSLGIASSKTLAKVAARFAKKYPAYHKCCHIANDEQREKALKLTAVEDVWGIGRRHTRSLNARGIKTAYDFTQRTRSWVKRFYHITGERTWRELLGADVVPLETMDRKRQTIMTSRTFPTMYTTEEELQPHVANYAARCALKLRKQNSVCGLLTVFARTNPFREDLPQYSGHATYLFPTPTASTGEIVKAAIEKLHELYRPGIHFKRAGVLVERISSAEAIQPDLFEFDPQRRKRLDAVAAAMDSINTKLGNDTVILASQQYPSTTEKGKSITFKDAIKRDMKSPDYSTSLDAFKLH